MSFKKCKFVINVVNLLKYYYFKCPVWNLDKPLASYVLYNNCKRCLEHKQILVQKNDYFI